MIDNKDLSTAQENTKIPDIIGVLPLQETCVLPLAVMPITVGQERSLKLVNAALSSNRLIVLVAEKDKNKDDHPFYSIGTLSIIHRVMKSIDGSLSCIVQGLERVKIERIIENEPFIKAAISRFPEISTSEVEIEALKRLLKELFQRIVDMIPEIPEELALAITKLTDARQISYLIASATPISYQARQDILETTYMNEKLRKIIKFLQEEIAVRDLQRDIANQTEEKLSKSQREFILREQIRTLQEELGEITKDENNKDEIEVFKERQIKLNLPEKINLELSKEIKRLERIPEISPEHAMLFEYIQFFLNLPWKNSTRATINISDATRILNQDHYDLDKVKERIIEYLAVLKLRKDRSPKSNDSNEISNIMHGPILCFVGPPGVGKTSLGESIARAIKRPFVRISLGGIHDEAEIRGHRRTYVGALPGRILKTLARSQTNDPVFMLDEIDKLHQSMQGDPAAALLEVLDPEQNHSFIDNYLGVPFDLSKVMFICTANTNATIPPPLLDRLEVIELSGYFEEDKLRIAKEYLIPAQRQKNGLLAEEFLINDEAILNIIREYTQEAGVRNLERTIGSIVRKIARKISEGQKGPFQIDKDSLNQFLQSSPLHQDIYERIDRPGIAIGLAWTPTGGDILFVEAAVMPGTQEKLILTGMMGDVMRESAEAALTYIRSHLQDIQLNTNCYKDKIIHVHVPAGSIPKDGPSAGVTILVALVSMMTNQIVKRDLAMTGEITLRGKILPIGGVRAKVSSAYRYGIKKVILPESNRNDLGEIPESIRNEMDIIFVNSAEDVLHEAFESKMVEKAI